MRIKKIICSRIKIMATSSGAKRRRLKKPRNANEIIQEPRLWQEAPAIRGLDVRISPEEKMRADVALTKDCFVRISLEEKISADAVLNQYGKQSIGEKQRTIEDFKNLQANKLKLQAQIAENGTRLQQCQDRLKELMEPSEFEDLLNELAGPLLNKLPDEILLKIFGYLSTYDILRNVAQVCKKFKKLSEDPFLIRKIELRPRFPQKNMLHPNHLTSDQIKSCLKVLQTSKNLRFFSFDLDWYFDLPDKEIFLNALPAFNHQHLEKFCIKGDGCTDDEDKMAQEASLIRKLFKYLEKCPTLKILEIQFTETDHVEEQVEDADMYYNGDNVPNVKYREFTWLEEENIFRCLKFPNLEELHFNGFDCPGHFYLFRNILNMFRRNLPKLRRLCCKLDNIEAEWIPKYEKILQKFASEKSVKIEIRGTPVYKRILEMEHPGELMLFL